MPTRQHKPPPPSSKVRTREDRRSSGKTPSNSEMQEQMSLHKESGSRERPLLSLVDDQKVTPQAWPQAQVKARPDPKGVLMDLDAFQKSTAVWGQRNKIRRVDTALVDANTVLCGNSDAERMDLALLSVIRACKTYLEDPERQRSGRREGVRDLMALAQFKLDTNDSLVPGTEDIVRGSGKEKKRIGEALVKGEVDISKYVNSAGVCYDTVAFVRSLLGAITADDLMRYAGQAWSKKLGFENGTRWDGVSTIPFGAAVGFRRKKDFLHAAVGTGGTSVRGVNGGDLSPGWGTVVDLTKVLAETLPDGRFKRKGEPDGIEVWWSLP